MLKQLGKITLLACLVEIIFWLCVLSCHAKPIYLTASWYSVESLKREGTWKFSQGVMANGEKFTDDLFICATRLFPLGSFVRVTNLANNRFVIVKVTDKIGKRFAETRIDLSPVAFKTLAGREGLSKGLIKVKVERIK